MPEIKTSVASRLSYRKTGAGPALLLLHGFPASGGLWRFVWNSLSTSFTLIIPDLSGTGDSLLEGETTMTDMAEAIKVIMDTEGIDRAVIAGHSMGGYIALEFARLYPHRVAGLSLIHSTSYADDDEKIKKRLKSIELIQKGAKELFISQVVPNLFSPAFNRSAPSIVKAQEDDSLRISGHVLVSFYKAMIARRDNSGILHSASFPLQWIFGINDNIISYKKILDKCHDSNVNFVSLYNDCGHMSMLEAPAKLTADLKQFSHYSYYRSHE